MAVLAPDLLGPLAGIGERQMARVRGCIPWPPSKALARRAKNLRRATEVGGFGAPMFPGNASQKRPGASLAPNGRCGAVAGLAQAAATGMPTSPLCPSRFTSSVPLGSWAA